MANDDSRIVTDLRARVRDNLVDFDFETFDEPRDPDLARLYAYWNEKRGARLMPSRADIDPCDFPWALPHIFLIEAVPPPNHYRYRIHGTALAEFHGRDFTGLAIHETVSAADAEVVLYAFDGIVTSRQPLFAKGPVFWCEDKDHKWYEACNLPLSADGTTVNMIFGAIKFAPMHLPQP